MPDPLLERLDEIIKRHLTLDLKQQSVISFSARVIRLEGDLRALMAEVAIESVKSFASNPRWAEWVKREEIKIRQRFGVGVEEKTT